MCDGQTNIFPLVKNFLPGLFSSNLPQNSLKTSAWTQAFNTHNIHISFIALVNNELVYQCDRQAIICHKKTFVTDKQTFVMDKQTFVTDKQTFVTDKQTCVTDKQTFFLW